MPESWMLQRLQRETTPHHITAETDRLSILTDTVEPARYRAYLSSIFGFEAPIEAAFALTPGMDDIVDLRARSHIRLLRSDLRALGVEDPSTLPKTAVRLRDRIDALGWIYVLQQNTLLHGLIARHLRTHIPVVMTTAGSYLAGYYCSGARQRELGAALDRCARSIASADRIVSAVKNAYRVQHGWYEGAAQGSFDLVAI
jgi:heme oxygenase